MIVPSQAVHTIFFTKDMISESLRAKRDPIVFIAYEDKTTFLAQVTEGYLIE